MSQIINIGDRVRCHDAGQIYYGTVTEIGLKNSLFIKYDLLHWMKPSSVPHKRATIRKDGTYRLSGTDYLVELVES